MTMNSNAYFLDVWEELKIVLFFFEAPFEKNSIFNENLPPEDHVRDKMWCQILLTLLTQDLEYLIGFKNLFGNMTNQTPIFWLL